MFHYTSEKQLSIFDFRTSFERKLNPDNRWVRLSKLIDWDSLAAIYGLRLSSDKGARGIDARIAIGALIIKHIEKKDDRGTIEMIRENPYMQYFLGLDHFTDTPLFDPSLFVHLRKRLGDAEFSAMNDLLVSKALGIAVKAKGEPDKEAPDDDSPTSDHPSNKGKLQLDATVCDANIKYPTDAGLLNECREKAEELIDRLCETLQQDKPRTYRRQARREWLNFSKKRRSTGKEIRKCIRRQLSFLKRDIGYLDKILENTPSALKDLNRHEYRYFLVIQEVFRQQHRMYKDMTHSIEHRIVSIHQPHIRPMVRGKEHRNVEFGPKVNISLQNGYARIDRIGFEAFNEGTYLKDQVESYKRLNGHYPELVQTDGIYMTQENRKYLKARGIRHTGKALGRKPKEHLNPYQKRKLKKERAERNHVEGKFGQGKNKYGLNRIMAKLPQTQESYIAAIFFVMNILKILKDNFWLIFNRIFFSLTSENTVTKNRLKPVIYSIAC